MAKKPKRNIRDGLSVRPIETMKLTKQAFMALETGILLASDVYCGPRESVFREIVKRHEKRAEQWKRILAAGAQNRICDIFKDDRHYTAFLNQFFPELTEQADNEDQRRLAHA